MINISFKTWNVDCLLTHYFIHEAQFTDLGKASSWGVLTPKRLEWYSKLLSSSLYHPNSSGILVISSEFISTLFYNFLSCINYELRLITQLFISRNQSIFLLYGGLIQESIYHLKNLCVVSRKNGSKLQLFKKKLLRFC